VHHPNIRFLVDRSNAGFVRQLKGVLGVAQIMIIRTYHLKQWRYCVFHFQPTSFDIAWSDSDNDKDYCYGQVCDGHFCFDTKKKCIHEQKQDEMAESPCYNKDRIDWLSIGPCKGIDR